MVCCLCKVSLELDTDLHRRLTCCITGDGVEEVVFKGGLLGGLGLLGLGLPLLHPQQTYASHGV